MQWVVLALLAAAVSPAGRMPDVLLRDSRDAPVHLAARFQGKPVVLIYEDRVSLEVNRPFKNALRASAQRLRDPEAIRVVAVANLSCLNFFPARSFALHGMQEAERKANHPILADWDNALARPPWNLPSNGSSVVVLSTAGEVLFAHTGPLSESDQAAVFTLLEKLSVR